jgi:hypothetical protein
MPLRLSFMLAGALTCVCPALADSGDDAAPVRPEETAYKFTLGRYVLSDNSVGWDANLRRAVGEGHAWLGFNAEAWSIRGRLGRLAESPKALAHGGTLRPPT